MVWDFAEINPLGSIGGTFLASTRIVADAFAGSLTSNVPGHVMQKDATGAPSMRVTPVVCTDPPYYANVGYADLADFFYIWLRRSLNPVYPDLFATLLTPKAQELIATPYRSGGDKAKARQFFEEGLGQAFVQMRAVSHPNYPLTVFYAFKQAEEDEDEEGVHRFPGEQDVKDERIVASTGWETILEGLLNAGFAITGTWPMRTERGSRSVSLGTNALAFSIVLVCRRRSESATIATRRELITALKKELPDALKKLQYGNIAPVDLAQAAIGPGMAVFSRFAKVLEADGTSMRVRTALAPSTKCWTRC